MPWRSPRRDRLCKTTAWRFAGSGCLAAPRRPVALSVDPDRESSSFTFAFGLFLAGAAARAYVALPPSCAAVTTPADGTTPFRELRKRVEAANESDPTTAFAILCTTIPRVAATYGERSVETAWWTAALATPLIAYMDKFDEALPMLQFAQPIWMPRSDCSRHSARCAPAAAMRNRIFGPASWCPEVIPRSSPDMRRGRL